jgi:hypothetical protein
MIMANFRKTALLIPILLLPAGCASVFPTDSASAVQPKAPSEVQIRASSPSPSSPTGTRLLKVDHVVIVVEENHSYREIVGNRDAPYMNQLIQKGASLNNHYAIEHPSQPNDMDLFSGSNQGYTDDKTHPAQKQPFYRPENDRGSLWLGRAREKQKRKAAANLEMTRHN